MWFYCLHITHLFTIFTDLFVNQKCLKYGIHVITILSYHKRTDNIFIIEIQETPFRVSADEVFVFRMWTYIILKCIFLFTFGTIRDQRVISVCIRSPGQKVSIVPPWGRRDWTLMYLCEFYSSIKARHQCPVFDQSITVAGVLLVHRWVQHDFPTFIPWIYENL